MTVKKVGRFILKLVLAIVVLVILLVVLLETGIVGRHLLIAAGNKIGLELTADDVQIGVGGTLRLRRFSAAYPDEESPFFTAHHIEISMNSLPAMLTRLEAGVTDIRLVGPVLTLHSDEAGQLNIAPLMTLRREAPERPESTGPLTLPTITLINGTVHYTRFGAAPITVPRIQFDSHQADDEEITFRLSLPGQNTLDGTIHTGTLEHAITLCIENAADLPELAQEDLPRNFRIRASWKGEMASSQPRRLVGDLNIQQLAIDNIESSLVAAVVIEPEVIEARLTRLDVNPWPLWPDLENPPAPLTAESGTVTFHYADRHLAVKELGLSLLGGDALINATLNLEQWEKSRGDAAFTGIDLSYFSAAALVEDILLSGLVNIKPATEPRAMEPMEVSLQLQLIGELFETAGLQEINAKGFLGRTRLVTNSATIPVFGGQVQPWISLTLRDDGIFAHVIAEVTDVEVERLVHTFTDQTEVIPGKLSGTLRGRTSGGRQTRSGRADISLWASDLMNTAVIGAVYQTMNLAFGDLDASGRGTVKLAAQGEKIEVMSFEYFNRGVEVRGAGAIEAVTMGKNSPVSGFATGSMRPLREMRIPGTRELDRLISVLQVGVATVKVEGTLGAATARVVPMPEVQNALRALLWQQLRE